MACAWPSPAVSRPEARGSAAFAGKAMLCSPDLEARRIVLVCLIAAVGCGGGERQDENEPEGDFAVEVVASDFPKQQKLAQSSDLMITVRNSGDETKLVNVTFVGNVNSNPATTFSLAGAMSVGSQLSSSSSRPITISAGE